MRSLVALLLLTLQCLRTNYGMKLQVQSPMKMVRAMSATFGRNPLARAVSNAYSFFYWLPRRNIPYDAPFMLFKNSSVDFIAWYQIPHNLPPYRYLVRENLFLLNIDSPYLKKCTYLLGRRTPKRFLLFRASREYATTR